VAIEGVIHGVDIAAVAVFAASGALTASRKELDIVAFVLVASVAGLGGGTLRDLLLGRAPVFWVVEPVYFVLCAAVAVVVFFTAHHVESRFRVLLWADALGLAFYAVLGTDRALAAGASGVVAVLMGMMTATFGGLARDLLCQETPLILRKEIYATAAAAGATGLVLLGSLGLDRLLAGLAGFALAFAVRAAAILLGWSIPAYRARPGRPY
jgi:uncharacterized membrane protein YeiH